MDVVFICGIEAMGELICCIAGDDIALMLPGDCAAAILSSGRIPQSKSKSPKSTPDFETCLDDAVVVIGLDCADWLVVPATSGVCTCTGCDDIGTAALICGPIGEACERGVCTLLL